MPKWKEVLADEWEAPYFLFLKERLEEEYKQKTIFPKWDDVLNALKYTPFDDVRVVILGQDPYHGPGQAHGLSFSVQPGTPLPPSLRNMYKELQADLGCKRNTGDLRSWAAQGVLLLNTVLTVEQGNAHSHKGWGWEEFTDAVIRAVSDKDEPVIFVLWGRPAQTKKALIDTDKHVIIESVHPSPLSASRGFFGSKPYSKINQQLEGWGQSPIDFCR
ncbi:uracil-DNA glycosylase [Tetzosporium hominis]|uniref:Uracil-DNA glycosylase n=1 Tax=Tetzosporium hominis TaxID=2020506 RepID=A0A264W262_9BACL|nr:uracil-DNA glycosylase [Tetzosporium hominis]OZS77655.1 uracil-DNA glycosylase [Tetzosporium hominis]